MSGNPCVDTKHDDPALVFIVLETVRCGLMHCVSVAGIYRSRNYGGFLLAGIAVSRTTALETSTGDWTLALARRRFATA